MAMRINLILYPAIIALTLSLLLAPALPVAAGSADRFICDLRFIIPAPHRSNPSTILGINNWRQFAGGWTHDSTGFDGFYLDRAAGGFVKLDPLGSSTADVLLRRSPVYNEGNISGRYLDSSGVNHDHFLTENAGRFLNPIDRPSTARANGFAVDDKENMAGAYVNSTNNLEPTYSLSTPGGALTTFQPPGSFDTGDLSDLGGIVDSCLKAGTSLINDNLNHPAADSVDICPRGYAAPGAENINTLGERDHRHTVVFRCFEW